MPFLRKEVCRIPDPSLLCNPGTLEPGEANAGSVLCVCACVCMCMYVRACVCVCVCESCVSGFSYITTPLKRLQGRKGLV